MLIGLFIAALPPLIAIGVTAWAIKTDANEPIEIDELSF